jgi:hypothetical protein
MQNVTGKKRGPKVRVNRHFPFHSARAWNEARRIADREVKGAITDGSLVRQPCETCGKLASEAHHDDYSKPLDVRWLCRKHHRAWHREHGTALESGAPFTSARRKNKSHASVAKAAFLIQDTTARLKGICDAIGMTQEDIAVNTGCSKQMVSIWFGSGFRTLKSVQVVCDALNLEASVSFKPKGAVVKATEAA